MRFYLLISNPWIIATLIVVSLVVAVSRYAQTREAQRRENVRRQRQPLTYKVRHDGIVHAGLTLPRIRQLVAASQINETDEYLDPMSGEWAPLDLLPNW